MSSLKKLLVDRTPEVVAARGTLIIASLRLLLFILILSYSLSRILLLSEDATLYAGKNPLIAGCIGLSVLSLGMFIDASIVLGRSKQSAAAGRRRGIAGTVLQAVMLPLSPSLFPRIILVAASAGMAICVFWFFVEIF